jgi:hypothetical protein
MPKPSKRRNTAKGSGDDLETQDEPIPDVANREGVRPSFRLLMIKHFGAADRFYINLFVAGK